MQACRFPAQLAHDHRERLRVHAVLAQAHEDRQRLSVEASVEQPRKLEEHFARATNEDRSEKEKSRAKACSESIGERTVERLLSVPLLVIHRAK